MFSDDRMNHFFLRRRNRRRCALQIAATADATRLQSPNTTVCVRPWMVKVTTVCKRACRVVQLPSMMMVVVMMRTMTVMMMMASVAEGCEARACGVQIRRLPVKNTGKQETVMSAQCTLPTVWGTVTLDGLEINARSMQSQIDNLYEEIHDLRDRVRSLEKKATAKRAGPAIAKPATKKAAKKARA